MSRSACVCLVALLAAGCAPPSSARVDDDPVADVRLPLSANVHEGRVRDFQPGADYFPDKTTFRYSRQLRIEYHGHYKILTVTPAPNPRERFEYVLVQKGTPAPPGVPAARVIQVPLRNFVLTHEELLGAAEIAGLSDKVIGLSSVRNVRAPGMRAGIDAGRIVAVGSGNHVDVERVIQLHPDAAMTYWSVNPAYDAHPVLNQAGIRTVVLASHWETSLLGAAEWMKVMAVLFNREREADAVFDGIAGRYERLAARARAEAVKPLVLMRLPFRHIWYVVPDPGEIADAGGQYFWPGERRSKGVDIEAVVRRGREAAAWIIAFPTPIRTQEELLAREPRLALLAPLQTGQVWNYDLPEVQTGGLYRDRLMRPDLVLADLVKILHPELVPDHRFVFFRRLDRTGDIAAAGTGHP